MTSLRSTATPGLTDRGAPSHLQSWLAIGNRSWPAEYIESVSAFPALRIGYGSLTFWWPEGELVMMAE